MVVVVRSTLPMRGLVRRVSEPTDLRAVGMVWPVCRDVGGWCQLSRQQEHGEQQRRSRSPRRTERGHTVMQVSSRQHH
jgi:hypothetical protein